MTTNTYLYANVQERWTSAGKGRRNAVTIRKRGPATKTVQMLGPGGRVLRTKTRKLSAAERSAILKGTFVSGLWRNCSLKSGTKNCRKM